MSQLSEDDIDEVMQNFETMAIEEGSTKLIEKMEVNAPEILETMEKSSWEDCIALLSKQETITEKMVRIVRKKILLSFPEKEIALQRANKSIIKSCILNGFERGEQLLLKAINLVKGKHADANSPLAKDRLTAKKIQNRVDYLFNQLIVKIYGDDTHIKSSLVVDSEIDNRDIEEIVKRYETPQKGSSSKKKKDVKENDDAIDHLDALAVADGVAVKANADGVAVKANAVEEGLCVT
jgi:hypothetical protein